eukprot:GEZU01023900.1.p1 GENE.GEZU01023900.1~~GEZU01023900.1.p1  ORF type:complete len:1157 (+),score=325.79 GEZU01023900.1:24-3473(+)
MEQQQKRKRNESEEVQQLSTTTEPETKKSRLCDSDANWHACANDNNARQLLRRSTTTQNNIKQLLPDDVLTVLFRFFDARELVCRVGQVCARWRKVSRKNVLWENTNYFQGFKVEKLSDAYDLISTLFRDFDFAPFKTLTLASNCKSINEKVFGKLRQLCPLLESVQFPVTTPGATQSVTNAVLRQVAKLSNLKHLNLRTHSKVTDEGLADLLRSAPLLETLIVDSCANVSSATFKTALSCCPRLKTFSAIGCNHCVLTADDLIAVADSGKIAKNLESLSISFSQLQQSLPKFVNCIPNLRSLYVPSWRDVDATMLTLICKRLSRLETLTLFFDELTDLTFPAFESESLREVSITNCATLSRSTFNCPNLEKLEIDSVREIHHLEFNCPMVKNLRLRSSKLFDTDTDVLTSKSAVQNLELFGCAGIKTAKIVSNTLETANIFMCPDVEEIYIEGSKLKSLTVDACMSLQTASVNCPNLETSQWFIIPQPQFPSLKTFSIQSDKLTSIGLQRCINLVSAKLVCPKLPVLNLADCKELEELELECPYLETLAISSPKLKFTKEYVERLVVQCPRVNMLSLSNIQALDDATLSAACELWNSLQALILSNCNNISQPRICARNLKGLQVADCKNLAAPSFNCPTLNKLVVRNCFRITDATFAGAEFSNLKTLELTQCHSIIKPSFTLPTLMELSINQCLNLVEPVINCPTLRKLVCVSLPSFVGCQFLSQRPGGNMLTEMMLKDCPKITDGFLVGAADSIPHLQGLIVSNCPALVNPIVPFRMLRLVQFDDCPRLHQPQIHSRVLDNGSFKKCPALEFEDSRQLLPFLQQGNGAAYLEFVSCDSLHNVTIASQVEKLTLAVCNNLQQLSVQQNGTAINNNNMPMQQRIRQLNKLSIFRCNSLASLQLACNNANHNNNQQQPGVDLSVVECNALASMDVSRAQISSFSISSCALFNDDMLQQLLQSQQQQQQSQQPQPQPQLQLQPQPQPQLQYHHQTATPPPMTTSSNISNNPNAAQLRSIKVVGCPQIVQPSVSHPHLATVVFNKNPNLRTFLSIVCPQLEVLDLSECSALNVDFVVRTNPPPLTLGRLRQLIFTGVGSMTQDAVNKLVSRAMPNQVQVLGFSSGSSGLSGGVNNTIIIGSIQQQQQQQQRL